jgi:hypothetical protein
MVGLPRHQIRLGCFGHQVKVNLPANLGAGLAQRAEESLAILVIKEDRFTPISPAHEVVDGTGKLNSQWSRHNKSVRPKNDRRLTKPPMIVNCKNRPIYGAAVSQQLAKWGNRGGRQSDWQSLAAVIDRRLLKGR